MRPGKEYIRGGKLPNAHSHHFTHAHTHTHYKARDVVGVVAFFGKLKRPTKVDCPLLVEQVSMLDLTLPYLLLFEPFNVL